jgi:hypothetical protein
MVMADMAQLTIKATVYRGAAVAEIEVSSSAWKIEVTATGRSGRLTWIEVRGVDLANIA